LAELAQLTASRLELDDQARDASIVVEDLTADQDKVDSDVEAVKARRARDRERMDQGLIANPKDLERMTHELESLERRINSLEDDEIEIMERLEEAQGAFGSLTAQLATTDARLAALSQARDEAFEAIDNQLAALSADRIPLVAGLPEDLLALYDKLRAAKAGIGAAALRARACGGCQLALDNAELAVIKAAPSDQVIRCEECQRILVRTAESGL
jgi:predicted  nucleic acid-binding Zn-ribbon protein